MKVYALLIAFLVAGFVCSESIATQRLGLFGRLRQRRIVQVRAPFVDVRVGGGFSRRDLDILRLQQLRNRQQFELRIPIQVDSFGGFGGGFGGQCSGFYR